MSELKQKLGTLSVTIVAIILPFILLGIRKHLFIIDNVSTNDWIVSIIFPIILILLQLVSPFLAKKIFPTSASFGLTWTQKPRTKIRWYVLLYLALLTSAITVRVISSQTGLPTMKFFNYKDVTQLPLIFFITAALITTILIPIVEEIFWRGFVQSQFTKCFGGILGVLLQACLFALIHGRPLMGFILVFAYGLIFGIWRLKRKSLIPIIIAHVIVNGLWSLGHYPDQYEMSKKNIAVNYVKEINKIGNIFPAKDNADADYKKAIELYHKPSDVLYDDKIIRKNLWPNELTVEQQRSLQQWLTQNSEALVHFRQGTQKPHYWPRYTGDMIYEADNFVEMSKLQELACALIWNAKIHANQGDIQQANDDLSSVCHFGNQFLTGPKPTISFIIGMSIKSAAFNTTTELLAKTELNTKQYESLQEQFQQVYKQTPSTLDLTWEKFSLYDTIQRTFTDDGDGNGHIPRAELKGADMKMLKLMSPGLTEGQIELWYQVDRKTTTDLVDKLFDFLTINFPSMPIQLKDENINIDSNIDEMMSKNVLYPYVSGINKIHTRFYENGAHQDALIATLAVLRYEKTNQSLPDTIEQLVSEGYLKSLPIDPFSGQSLIYKKDKDSFLLYSVGEDFDDDGGHHDKQWGKTDGDYVFWPIQENQEMKSQN